MASYSFIRERFVDGLPPIGDLRQVKVNALREELSALLQSILDRAFKGEL